MWVTALNYEMVLTKRGHLIKRVIHGKYTLQVNSGFQFSKFDFLLLGVFSLFLFLFYCGPHLRRISHSLANLRLEYRESLVACT